MIDQHYVPIEAVDFKKMKGLLPVVTQDADSKQVLMLAYADYTALKKSIETGYAYYYSRSRQKLWKKGETSGHVQRIKGIMIDCDADTLLYLVDQTGPACHTGNTSCFYQYIFTSQ